MSATTRHEMVGILADRTQFDRTLAELAAAGFERADISVLAAHQSVEAAESTPGWRDSLVALWGDLKYEGPFVDAGMIALAAGPVGAAISAAVAAGVGGAALSETLAELSALPHRQSFARALAERRILIWVSAQTPDRQEMARRILESCGAADVHLNERAANRPTAGGRVT